MINYKLVFLVLLFINICYLYALDDRYCRLKKKVKELKELVEGKKDDQERR